MTGQEALYDAQSIGFLEDMWGEGFLSPGGAEEAARVVEGLDLSGATVLDIGCGTGAGALLLAGQLGAARVVGLDVEAPVCAAARRRVAAAGMSARIEIVQAAPGPLPFGPESFDVIYSKDAIIHIPDKEALAADVWRLLRPGGWFAASDWLIAHDGPPSAGMQAYIAAEDLDFAMASPARYRRALAAAGFTDVTLRNRNPWYRDVAAGELARLTGPERTRLERDHGAAFIAHQIDTWTKMLAVLRSGEHCPHHLRGQKPG